VPHRRVVRRVHLARAVAAAVELPDRRVVQVRHPLLQLRVGAEELLAHEVGVARLERLVLAVHGLGHAPLEQPVVVGGEQRVPVLAPDHLDHVPARAAEVGLELLDDLAVAADRPVEALQVAVDHEDEVVQVLAAGERDGAHRLGLVHLAVAHERPHLAARGVLHAAPLEVLQEPRLVDRHDRPEPHRDGGELPEVRHQPGVGIRGEAVAADLLAEVDELLLGEAALEERAGVDARRGVALDVDEVAAVVLAGRVPEVVEAHLVERRRRLEAGDVAAELARLLVRLEHHRRRVPADGRPQPPLHLRITRDRRLVLGVDRVDVRRLVAHRDGGALEARLLHEPAEELGGAIGAGPAHHVLERVEPLLGLARVGVPVGLVRGYGRQRVGGRGHTPILGRPGPRRLATPRRTRDPRCGRADVEG
jgi:hypothetical protein